MVAAGSAGSSHVARAGPQCAQASWGGRLQGERTQAACRRRGRDERGQVVVLFALPVPLLFVIGSIVIDVWNWYVHKRNLQTMVDAAAFAGATKFVGCSERNGDPVAANQAIKAT